jgi:OOP family OmpA-OmpF porin
MKKLITTIVALSAGLVSAQTVNNWVNANGQPWKNSVGQCWRNASWTPATAHTECDGAIKTPESKPPMARVQVTIPPPVVLPRIETPQPPKTVVLKQSIQTETLFDFDKSVIKPDGRKILDDLVDKLKDINLEVVIAVGHTDSIGTEAYNMKLGQRRAEAVKAYLISKGIEKNRVYTESKGERQPVADNKTAQGRAKNRRVEIEVVGTVK